jgi:Domain of unknown function (DUF4398)
MKLPGKQSSTFNMGDTRVATKCDQRDRSQGINTLEGGNQMKGKRSIHGLLVVVMGLSILWLSGCSGLAASSREKISDGDKALVGAKESNASVNAPVELKAAEDKLGEAKAAFAKKDYDNADRLADQALADADYARAKGSTEKTRKKSDEIRQNIKTLKQDIELLSKKMNLEGGK